MSDDQRPRCCPQNVPFAFGVSSRADADAEGEGSGRSSPPDRREARCPFPSHYRFFRCPERAPAGTYTRPRDVAVAGRADHARRRARPSASRARRRRPLPVAPPLRYDPAARPPRAVACGKRSGREWQCEELKMERLCPSRNRIILVGTLGRASIGRCAPPRVPIGRRCMHAAATTAPRVRAVKPAGEAVSRRVERGFSLSRSGGPDPPIRRRAIISPTGRGTGTRARELLASLACVPGERAARAVDACVRRPGPPRTRGSAAGGAGGRASRRSWPALGGEGESVIEAAATADGDAGRSGTGMPSTVVVAAPPTARRPWMRCHRRTMTPGRCRRGMAAAVPTRSAPGDRMSARARRRWP